jgi:chitin synthase
MYLAEDRILCLGIHALEYDLHYLPDVESSVDPVTSLTKLLGQRRRWINGSWFAFNYVREHSYESSSYFFLLQLLYYSFVQKLQWIGPTLFYLAMNLTLISFITNNVVPAI